LKNVHKIIAVYGNSGSYKTTVAVNVAKAIAKVESGAKIAVVGADHTKPFMPLIFPDSKGSCNLSLGKLLSCETLSQEAIHAEMKEHNNIGFLGYNSGENIRCFPITTADRLEDFFMQIRHLVNYVIVDCGSDVHTAFTSKTLITADEVLYTISCDVNGLEFFHSQESILLSEQYSYNNYIKLLTINGRFTEDEETMKGAIGDVEGVIPFCECIPEMWNQGKALNPVPDAKYNEVMKGIAKYLTKEE